MARKKYDDEVLRARVLELREKGLSYREIAKEIGCSVYKVYEVLHKLGKTPSQLMKSKLAELESRSKALEELIRDLKPLLRDLRELFAYAKIIGATKMNSCKYFKNGYCTQWIFKEKQLDDLVMVSSRGRPIYMMYVVRHPMYCAFCHLYKK